MTDYGAKGDGSTNDTGAIQAALTNAGGRGVVSIPPGNFVTTAPLNVPPGTSLVGAGPLATTLHCRGEGVGLQLKSSPAQPHHGTTVRDLSIRGSQTTNVVGNHGIAAGLDAGSYALTNSFVLLHGLFIEEFGDAGLFLGDGALAITVFGGRIRRCRNAVKFVGQQTGANSYGTENAILRLNVNSVRDYAVHVENFEMPRVDGLMLDEGADKGGFYIRNVGSANPITPAASLVTGVRTERLRDGSTWALLDGASGVRFIANTILSPQGGYGIRLTNGSRQNVIHHNVFPSDAGAVANVYIDDAASIQNSIRYNMSPASMTLSRHLQATSLDYVAANDVFEPRFGGIDGIARQIAADGTLPRGSALVEVSAQNGPVTISVPSNQQDWHARPVTLRKVDRSPNLVTIAPQNTRINGSDAPRYLTGPGDCLTIVPRLTTGRAGVRLIYHDGWDVVGHQTQTVAATWRLPALAPGEAHTTILSAPGASDDDIVVASHNRIGSSEVVLSAHVQRPGTVRVTARNLGASTADLGEGTLRLVIQKLT